MFLPGRIMSSLKKVEGTSKCSLISTQDEVDAILNDFGITGVEAILSIENDTISSPPKGFIAYITMHI